MCTFANSNSEEFLMNFPPTTHYCDRVPPYRWQAYQQARISREVLLHGWAVTEDASCSATGMPVCPGVLRTCAAL